MTHRIRAFAAGCLASIVSFAPAGAIEPDAPRTLISQEEAAVIAVRQRIERLPSSKALVERKDRSALAAFYASHTGPLLWVDGQGLTERAVKLIQEIQKAGEWGLDASNFDLPSRAQRDGASARLIDDELRMSLAVLKYARHARGGRMDPKELSVDIDRTPPLEDPHAVLTALQEAGDPVRYLRDLHPKHAQFEKLRKAYLDALAKERRSATQDRARASAGKSRRSKRKRRRKSATALSRRLLYNMEMWRWMPRELGSRHVAANIPEYKVRVIDGSRTVHEERMVVGKVQNQTAIFSDEMETIVFHPFWLVPNSIKVKELLPSLVRGGNALDRQGLRMSYGGRDVNPRSINWSKTDIRKYHVYQPPGRRNALGIVKFLFPNKHAIYFHDTPSKHLFKRKRRAYSHGCMRVRDPLKLAEVLLGDDKGWSRSRIDGLIKRGPKDNQIALNRKVPVHVTYFTARVDDAGKTHFFRDVYGHEKRIQMGLDGKAHLIVKRKTNLEVARRKVVSRVASRPTPPRDQSWRRRVLGNLTD